MPEKKYVQVAFPIPVCGNFTYLVPEGFQDRVTLGTQVLAFLGKRKLSGFVVGLTPREDLKRIRYLEGLVRPEPVFDSRMLELSDKVAEHYMCPVGEVLAAAYPGHKDKRPHPEAGPAVDRTPERIRPVEERVSTGPVTSSFDSWLSPVIQAAVRQETGVFVLTLSAPAREQAYVSLARASAGACGSVLFLVPEVSTGTTLVERLQSEFGKEMALFHSKLRISQRKEIWEASRTGHLRVVAGTRSAVFLPLRGLRLVVVDDEHAQPFKQEETPRYHGRDVALMRARLDQVPVVLGSATPSVETYWALKRGEYRMLSPAASEPAKPRVSVVDMRRREDVSPLWYEFSPALVSAVQAALAEHRRVLLFLNRRGFSTWVQCLECGSVESCPSCELPMVLHSEEKALLCHHCGRRADAPASCGKCRGVRFKFGGAGVERVAVQLRNAFPGARIARVDFDTSRSRERAVSEALRFATGEIDILVGTLMVTKGLELGDIPLVGVLHAEAQLNIPDFRSGERAYELLSEIASLVKGPYTCGTAGKPGQPPPEQAFPGVSTQEKEGAQDAAGMMIIQTLNPEHHSISAVSAGDRSLFYEQELRQREELGYPPFSTLVALYVTGTQEAQVQKVIRHLSSAAASLPDVLAERIQVLGPAPGFPSRLRGRHRWHMILKGADRRQVAEAAGAIMAELGGKHEIGGVTLSVDVDPVAV